jgi:four helix bundle protein
MAGVTRFQDLEAHKLAAEIRRRVFRLTRDGAAARDYKFVAQIRDAARGGTRNIAEGFSRFNPTEFHQFLSYSKSSLDETIDALDDGLESEYFTQHEHDELVSLIARANGAIGRLMAYLESSVAKRFYAAHKARRAQGTKVEPSEPE